jgi:hypothetical protein
MPMQLELVGEISTPRLERSRQALVIDHVVEVTDALGRLCAEYRWMVGRYT